MAALWLARASSQLARRAARRLPARHGSGEPTSPWFLGAAPPPALGSPAVETSRRAFCSVWRFAGESAAAAAVDEEPENGFPATSDQQALDFPGGKVSFVAEH